MRVRIQKWGNSLALRVPKPFARALGLSDGSPAEPALVGGKLVVAPVARPGAAFEQLLTQVTDDNLHPEVDTGPAVGNEA